MLMTIAMDTGRVEMSGMKALGEGENYSPEVMGVEWNPVLPALQEAAEELASQVLQRHSMPPHLAEMDVDAFLRQMYAAQR